MASQYKDNVRSFLSSVIENPVTSIPKGAQWVIAFGDSVSPEGSLLKAIDEAYKLEPNNALWKTTEAAKLILTEELQRTRGCMLAQAISIPGERTQVNPGGNIQSNNLLRSRVGGGRDDLAPLQITFLETNVSFADSFLRGWALATATFGLIALPKDHPHQYRTDLYCYKFGFHGEENGPTIKQEIIFKGVCCTYVSDEEYNYTPLTSPVLREAEFIYNSYSIDTTQGLPGKNESSLENESPTGNL